jgi:hypothetical protein
MITNTKYLSQTALYSLIASLTVISLLFTTFFLFEPSIGHAVDSNPFRIRQTITDETSFSVQPSNVTMNGSIAGVTGGTANGSTTFAVISNNASGYTVSIDFHDNLTANAMRGDTGGSETLRDYSGDVAGEPSYNFTASTAAQFAYTVTSLNSSDTEQSFLDNGSNACNQNGGSQTTDRCWKAPETSPFTIINRVSSAVTGATSTISFRVVVPSGSVPAVTADTYTATATLTLLVN